MSQLVMQTDFPGLKLMARGKVRDIYDLGDTLLLVTSDRISAFDVIMNEPIPDKGFVLTQISAFWFRQMEDIVKNHIISTDVADFPAVCQPYADVLKGRSMWVKKAKPLAGRMHRSRLCLRLGLEGLQGHRFHLRHQAAGRAEGIRPSAGTDLHPLYQGRTGSARREYLL